MEVYIERLLKRAKVLGNHHKKYIVLVERNVDNLMERLENARMIDEIHLDASAHGYHEEMQKIVRLGSNLDEKLSDLGCYFALQFLHLNTSALDALTLELSTVEERCSVYKNFMLRVGHDFRKLTAAYLESLLYLFLPEKVPEFVFLGVGTRSDQDDIDIGVVDRGPEGRDVLNKAIGRMNSEMFKKAISLHFHLSEHVGSPASFSASIGEYCQLLDNEIHDFVIITEMLGAARIIGSRRLLSDFRRNITFRYYYNQNHGQYLRYHEGYLRGIVGEARSFMFKNVSRDKINPKNDGLRMIKAGLFAAKTIYFLRQVNAWAILDTLKTRDKKRQQLYMRLEEPLTFLEVFRYLYQLLIAQEEEIYLHESNTSENLSLIAKTMGYHTYGAATAKDFLIIDYYKNIQIAKDTIKKLLPYTVNHLSTVTIFGKILRHEKVTGQGERRLGNLALRFLQETRFFKGTRFWDDIISVLERKNGQILKRLVNDMCSLPPGQMEKVLDQYIAWAWNSFIATFHFLILIHRYRESFLDCRLFEKFNERFFYLVRGTEEEAQRLSVVFKFYPKLLYDYICLLTEYQQRKFYQWMSSDVWDREVLPDRNRLQYLLKLHFSTSKYFKRIMNRVINRNPEYLEYLNNPHRLRLIGKGLMAEVERTNNLAQKLFGLATFHDLEYFRACLNTLNNNPSQTVAMEFVEFSDTYLRSLFDTCKQKVDFKRTTNIKTKDLLGVFVTGGHGHMLAFDDDYDLIILLNAENKEIHDYASEIISHMHKEIIKTGIMPHYRLADYTFSYICTFKQLKEILNDPTSNHIVDKSQLLGARMVVGSSVLQKAFEQNFIQPFIYDDYINYIQSMVKEIQEHQRSFPPTKSNCINIKESPGGLRDIELFLFICRALYKIQEYSNYKLMLHLASIEKSNARIFQTLYKSYEFLRKIRNLNRIIIAAYDEVDFDHLDEMMDLDRKDNEEPLSDRLMKTMTQVQVNIHQIIQQVVLVQLSH